LLSTACDYPFQRVLLDFIGPLPNSLGFRFILMVIDRFSRWCKLRACASTDAKTVVEILFRDWICEYGVPGSFGSDGGSHFDNDTLQEMARLLRVLWHINTPYHHQSNAVTERANRIAEDVVRSFIRDDPEWSRLLPQAQFAMNTSVNRTTGMSPFVLIHGFPPRLPLHGDLGVLLDTDTPVDLVKSLLARGAQLIHRAKEAENAAFQKARAAFLRQSRRKRSYDVGSYVLVHHDRRDERLPKLALEWRGPYEVASKVNDVIYTVRDLNTDAVHRVHIDRLHEFYPGSLTPEQLQREALHSDEFPVDAVLDHRWRDGVLEFRIRYDGFEDYDPADDRAWSPYEGNETCVQIQEYLRAHAIDPAVPPPAQPAKFPPSRRRR
jgi:hypothetical protein